MIPLLLERGAAISTREISEAAGVAEGTVFSVFPDKASVIIEAVKVTVDPESTRAALAEIPADAPLAQQLECAAGFLMERGERVGTLVGVLRTMAPPDPDKRKGAHTFMSESHAAILSALAELFERSDTSLKVAPDRAAVVFWGLVFANAHSLTAPDERLVAGEIVEMVLHGIVRADPQVGI